jgi:Zn-dependent protease
MSVPNHEILTGLVGRIFRIEDLTLGEPGRGFVAVYRGRLLDQDSAGAYARLAESLKPHEITPLFRSEGGRQVIYLLPGVVRPKLSSPWVNLLLFVLTLLSVMLTGALSVYQGPQTDNLLALLADILPNLWLGWPFAASLLAILLAHEFGHYLAGRFHRTAVSLPYFIPFPFSLLGTLGAFIQMKEVPRNKRVLLDIGAAGPLAGLAVTIPVLLIGLALSEVKPVRDTVYQTPEGAFTRRDDDLMEGNSLLYLSLKYAVHGELLPAPVSYGDTPPALHWLGYILTGQPVPLGGRDVLLHPVALAGWAGLLVTFLNLIPAGQLDGGHILYTLLGRRTRTLLPFILLVLFGLGFLWAGWWLWAGLLFLLGRVHAEPLDQITPLDGRRKLLAAFMLLVFLAVLTPVPFVVF